MVDQKSHSDDSGRAKRQKTENMDKSNTHSRGMNDDDGGVPLYASPSEARGAGSTIGGGIKLEPKDPSRTKRHRVEESDTSDVYLPATNDNDGGVPLNASARKSVKAESVKVEGQ